MYRLLSVTATSRPVTATSCDSPQLSRKRYWLRVASDSPEDQVSATRISAIK